jgi:adenine-specific DNA-methyltransferase
MSNFDALVAKLREIFQIDRPDLDFGVYRILNARAGEIEDYLSKRLKARVAEALAAGAAANTETLKADIAKAEKAAEEAGISADQSPKVQQLRAQLAAASGATSEHENQVFSHLLTFFSRYYDKGDFISQRRYKGDTYAIPYSGEEVVLHWANRDQYYIKSGESFSNFSFKLDDGRLVHFRLVAADTAKDNRKDNDKERRFVLATERTVTRLDEEGEGFEETIRPIEEEDGALVIRFDFAAQPKGTKQEKLVEAAVETILDSETVKSRWLELTNRAPTEKKPQRTLLEKHLTTYTQKNTADYFIHKDLDGFLRRELDFYIKNEVMNLDDVQEAGAFAAIERNLRMIQCLRAIALDLITFLASIENFQKKLWLKKKFVVAAQYCVTLDRVPEALYPAIAANPEQWAQWHDLGMRASAAAGTVEDLKAAPFLMVDTALFDAGFRADLLKAIPDLDASLDGLLVHGDNFQALTLLVERYAKKVDFIYIDPPYNTVHSKIAYKNQFEHSSWLSLIANTLDRASAIVTDKFSFGFAIDDYEYNNALLLLRQHFSSCDVSTIVVNHHPQGSGGRLSRTHEYYIVASPESAGNYLGKPKPDDTEDRQFMRSGTADNNYRAPKAGGTGRWRSFYALLVDPTTRRIVGAEPPPPLETDYPLGPTEDGRERIYPINSSGEERVWRSSYLTGKARAEAGELFVTERGAVKQAIEHEDKREVLFSNWIGSDFNAGTQGTAILDSLGLGGEFDYPKSVKTLEQAFWMQGFGSTEFLALDYFAGSGTTAHALLSLNRQDGGKRKYIMVEQGPYFETALKPRIMKVAYSSDWSSGKPTAPETGISHAFKVLKIEGYEDALNNLNLKRSDAQASLLEGFSADKRDDYLMRYMLDVEAKGSLLSVQDFRKPFDYTLKVAVDSAGAWEERNVDLVETFNYLIGLTVRSIDIQLKQGFATVEGTLPTGEKTLILWRDCEKIGYEELTRLCDKLAINPADSEYDVVYINGDHNIPSVVETTEEEGSVIKKLMLRQIEPAFLDAMFNVDDV